ncbi:unnamed protein product [Acanthoscelides obtectus]|uniref:Uncharacterized protein n=1 Tax=Acanthoscelides obtectus TaxID=200917 RepID=A0A9P0MA74_ACAOB|nr:unnamed protein product [Acanthoscelides obtectus]CAK1638570.1 hypothetical protein AOBTE_LOCUS10672 [Acanthoscelides obtectus]
MHELFLINNPELSVKYSYYRKTFKERFSLSFGRPQVDTCCTCEELSNKIKSKALNDVAKSVAVAEKIVYQRRAKKFYSKMKSIVELCQTDPSVGAICVDYMQNLALSVIPVQDTFYLHQLTNIMEEVLEKKIKFHFRFQISCTLAEKGLVTARDFIDGLIKHEFSLGASTAVRTFPDVVAYPNSKVPISAKKMVSIRKFEKLIVEKGEEIENYREIFGWPTVGGTDDDVDEN